MSFIIPTWRCFRSISSDAEALSVSECCLFSLATLEVDCDPDTKRFALTERERPGIWRWAIISDRGCVIDAGSEATQEGAKKVAGELLHCGSQE